MSTTSKTSQSSAISTTSAISASSMTSADSAEQCKGNVPGQVETRKILRFYRVPGKRFKTLDDLLKYKGYKLGNKLRDGKYSVLYLATHLKTNITVACKQIDVDRARLVSTTRELARPNTTIMSYIENELSMLMYLLKPLACPYILKLYLHFVANRTLYMFLKLAPEGNLAKYVSAKGPLSEAQSVVIFGQMAVVLEYLYSRQVTHRDITLESVLLMNSPAKNPKRLKVVITNFGASRLVSSTKEQPGMCHTACGAFSHMPPEVLDNKAYNPFPVDIWMAGVTLYAMLSGAVPFAKENSKMQLQAQCERSWQWPPNFRPSAHLDALMKAMLDPDPAKRINVSNLVAHGWVEVEYKRAHGRLQKKSVISEAHKSASSKSN